MRVRTLFLLASLGLVGCAETTTPARHTVNKPAAPGDSTVSQPAAPDNTGVNKRDADGSTLTPIDQNENQRDVQITADIRKRVIGAENLSINARNAKIITADGKVTLRGPVASVEEKDELGKIALTIAGDGNVTNLLEVTEP